MSSECQIARLRGEIRTRGLMICRMRSFLRKVFWRSLGIVLCGLSALFAVMVIVTGPGAAVDAAKFVLQTAAILLTVPLVAAALLMFPAPSVSRRFAVRHLRACLDELPRGALRDLLLPLTRDPDADTRQIATSLARGTRLSSELAPAAASDARGDEGSPADQAP